ncbi:MAG: insulinase family protein [Prevotellaceae bacterium]|jgi:zinc protease|nr:insulinase family protein [Prevotellaceae bacterium]
MKKTILTFVILFVCVFASFAQTPVPMDTAIRYGKLPNGLTYYIRHNALPAERANFYIVQRVGAILEEDSQNGLAHFLEHIAFNGTKNFPGKGIIEYMESIGAQFGANVNAYTSLDETVYMLRNIPVPRQGVADSALLILHDWSSFISLEDDEINKERGVIREEWRTGATADRRMWKEGNRLKFPGSQYAKRDVIGDTAVINNFLPDTLRAYYRKWYRPDLQAIVIVGDIDAAKVEASMHRIFADIPAPVNPAKRIIYTIPDNREPIVSIVTDPEAAISSFDVMYKHKPLPEKLRLSEEGYDLSLANGLISMMISERFSQLSRNPTLPFTNGYGFYGNYVLSCDVFAMGLQAKEGQEKLALPALFTEVERLKRYGFTQSELDLAKRKLLTGYEKLYNERDKIKSSDLVEEYTRNFLEAEPVPGIEWEYHYAEKTLGQKINLQFINDLIKTYISDTNLIVDISAPQKESVKLPTEAEVLAAIQTAHTNFVAAYEDKTIDKPLLDKKPKAGNIVTEHKNDTIGTQEWLLSNGVRVIFMPTEHKNDEILFSAYSEGGISLVQKIEDLPSAYVAEKIVSNNGLGKFNKNELRQILAGKRVSLSSSIDAYSEGMNGSSSVRDFETLLQLVYLNFTATRKDGDAFDAFMQKMKTDLANADADPRKAFNDTLSMVLSSYSPRTVLANLDTWGKIKQQKALQEYKKRFANPADFTFIFVGNINLDSVKPLIESYLGGMKTTNKRETWCDRGIRYPGGEQTKFFDAKMEVARSSVYLFQWAKMPYTFENKLNMLALGDILDIRYTASIREDEGGTYGVRVAAQLGKQPQEQASLAIRFDTNPVQANKLIGIATAELDSIVRNGVRPDDLDKVKKNLLKRHAENLKENGWWRQAILSYEKDGFNLAADYEKTVNALTSESIRAVLKTLLDADNRIVFKMNPQEK